MSQPTFTAGGWADNDYDDYGFGFYGGYYGGYNRGPSRPHDRALDLALYAKWSSDYGRGFQYLADAYNEHVRKENEPILLPPPPLG